jgi:hypothetical protein
MIKNISLARISNKFLSLFYSSRKENQISSNFNFFDSSGSDDFCDFENNVWTI